MNIAQVLSFFILLIFSICSSAHPVWVKPDLFNISTEEGEWVTFDVSASHTVFGYDKPMPLGALRILSPDGDSNYLGSYFQGRRRSVFDYEITQEGTYRFTYPRQRYYWTSFKAGKRESLRWIGANKIEATPRLPKNAREVTTKAFDMESSAYVTKGAPSNGVIEARDRGFEYIPVTHPNDLIVGESAVFKVMLDGKPMEGINIEFTPDGTRYRDDRLIFNPKTDKDGLVEFTPDRVGLWYTSANHTFDAENGLADEIYTVRFITLEVLPE